MPISFSFTRIADGELTSLEDVAKDVGVLYELLVDVGIKCTWTGDFRMAKFEEVTRAFCPEVKAKFEKYVYKEFKFDSWR